MTTIFPVLVKCPNCGTVFKSTTLGSYGHASVDECGCQRFWGLNPMPFFIRICPSCEFIDWDSSFSIDRSSRPEGLLREERKNCDLFMRFGHKLEEKGEIKPAMLVYFNAGCCYRVEHKEEFQSAFQEAIRLLEHILESEGDVDIQGIRASSLLNRLKNCSSEEKITS
ncbi:MAG: DUF2225 domain-containing protein [Promethearchaeota archaeon]